MNETLTDPFGLFSVGGWELAIIAVTAAAILLHDALFGR